MRHTVKSIVLVSYEDKMGGDEHIVVHTILWWLAQTMYKTLIYSVTTRILS